MQRTVSYQYAKHVCRALFAFIMHSTHTNPPHDPTPPTEWRIAGETILVFCCALLAALLGILTRPHGALALFWPANALLLGLFLRWPRLADIHGWLAATAGLCIADLIVESTMLSTLWLTSSNMVGIAAGYLLCQMQPSIHRKLAQPSSMLRLLVISISAALAGAIAGAGSAPFIIGRSSLAGFCLWFSNELLNFIAILPAMLTIPDPSRWRELLRSPAPYGTRSKGNLLPLLSLCVLAVLGIHIGTPEAMTLLPLLALLWCAARYSVFSTSLLTLAFSLWLMNFAWSGQLNLTDGMQVSQIIVMRLLAMLILMLPLLISTHSAFQRTSQP